LQWIRAGLEFGLRFHEKMKTFESVNPDAQVASYLLTQSRSRHEATALEIETIPFRGKSRRLLLNIPASVFLRAVNAAFVNRRHPNLKA
jgi:hypothetical protein